MGLAEFYDELEKHDWHHMMSDSNSVHVRGEKNYKRLNDIAMEGTQEHRDLLVAFRRYKYDNNGEYKKPSRPIE